MTVYKKLKSLQKLPPDQQREQLKDIEKLFKIGKYSAVIAIADKKKIRLFLYKETKWGRCSFMKELADVNYNCKRSNLPIVVFLELPSVTLKTVKYLSQVFEILQSKVE